MSVVVVYLERQPDVGPENRHLKLHLTNTISQAGARQLIRLVAQRYVLLRTFTQLDRHALGL